MLPYLLKPSLLATRRQVYIHHDQLQFDDTGVVSGFSPHSSKVTNVVKKAEQETA